jgi:hypothetical protein
MGRVRGLVAGYQGIFREATLALRFYRRVSADFLEGENSWKWIPRR